MREATRTLSPAARYQQRIDRLGGLLDEAAVGYHVVLTKADKVKASELAEVQDKVANEARKHPAAHPLMLTTSSEKGMGIEELRDAVLDAIG